MISDADFIYSLMRGELDAPYPIGAFHSQLLAPPLQDQLKVLGQAIGPDTLVQLCKIAGDAEDEAQALEIFVAFACWADWQKADAPFVVGMADQIKARLYSGQFWSPLMQASVEGLLCALIRWMRWFGREEPDGKALAALRTAFHDLSALSQKVAAFRKLAGKKASKVLKKALGLGDDYLDIGLACCDPTGATHYGTLMIETAAKGKRRGAWMRVLRLLHACDKPSFMQVSASHAESMRLRECALMLACIDTPEDRAQFEQALAEKLAQATMPYSIEDMLFTVKVLAMLYEALDAAQRNDGDRVFRALEAYWQLQPRGLLHRRTCKKLIGQLKEPMHFAEATITKFWGRIRIWLLELEPARALSE